ncbi:Protein of unknown function [Gryllus bimaculatus]|nr:Protein of unknown function [Gryllus bimaculatus]
MEFCSNILKPKSLLEAWVMSLTLAAPASFIPGRKQSTENIKYSMPRPFMLVERKIQAVKPQRNEY